MPRNRGGSPARRGIHRRRRGRARAVVARLTLVLVVVVGVTAATLAAVRWLPTGGPATAGWNARGSGGSEGETSGQPAFPREADAGDAPWGGAGAGREDSPQDEPLPFANAPVNIHTDGFLGWALMDRRSGEIWGSTNLAETTWPASMIKAWIAADYLRRAHENGVTPSAGALHQIEIMIRDSDNNAAIQLHSQNGGAASIERMIKLCGLTDTTPNVPGGWSFTNISARDTVRMADCIADGVAGPEWTSWLLEQMRAIRIGDWGIREALPEPVARTVSIKNGWLRYDDDGLWHINCLAVADTWAMSVLQRYRGTGNWNQDFLYGQRVCRDVALQLINPAYPYDIDSRSPGSQ
ncbi:MAG TPA: hypothetical protein VK028_14285 [Micromonosporaceae bacterium]|nr:hypothetical protein [Micromonosporaceae bacterium]